MGIFLLWTGFSFFAPEGDLRTGMVAAGIYMFMVVYSPGEGPVPFTYSAEAFPLYIRDIGMSFATATTWGFNFILSLTWPALVRALRPQGAFGFYAAWNFFGFVFAYFLLPETKVCLFFLLIFCCRIFEDLADIIFQNLTLEELDDVFTIKNRDHATYYKDKLPWYLSKYVLRKDVPPVEPLYHFHG